MKMTLGRRIASVNAGLIALTALVGAIGWWAVRSVEAVTVSLAGDSVPGVVQAARARGAVYEFRGNTWKHIATGSDSTRQSIDAANRSVATALDGAFAEYDKTISDEEDRALFTAARRAATEYLTAWEPVRTLSNEHKTAEAEAAAERDLLRRYNAAREKLNALVKRNEDMAGKMLAAAVAGASRARGIILLLNAIGATLGILAMLWLIRDTNKNIGQAVAQLLNGASQVAASARQVAATSQSLAQGSSEQAATLEQSSASSEEIGAMCRQNETRTSEAAQLVVKSEGRFDQAGKSIEQMTQTMSEIAASSQKVSTIIKVIDEIAFQTNILALNAAVEAARDGEAGMGFAVVADEVRNLAQRSAQEAKDTTGLIEEPLKHSQTGRDRVNQVSSAIEGIIRDSRKVKELVESVNAGSGEQTRGIEQVSTAIRQLQSVTQEMAASSEEGAAAAEELSSQSQEMRDTAARLEELVGANR